MKTHISLFLFFFLSVAQLATAEEIIENKTFENGLQLKDKKDVIIRNCHISNPEGHALFLSNCENVIIEKCIIRKAGNEKTTILTHAQETLTQTISFATSLIMEST